MFTADTSYHSWPQIARSWDIAASLDLWVFQSGPMNFPIARHPFAIHPTQTNKYLRSLAWMQEVMTYDKSLESLMKRCPVSLCWNASQLLLLWPSAQKLYGTQQLPSVLDGGRGGWALTCQTKLYNIESIIISCLNLFYASCLLTRPDAPIQNLKTSGLLNSLCLWAKEPHRRPVWESSEGEGKLQIAVDEQQFSKIVTSLWIGDPPHCSGLSPFASQYPSKGCHFR